MINLDIDTTVSKKVKLSSVLDLPTVKVYEKAPLIVYLHGAGERDISFELFKQKCSIRNDINNEMGFALLMPQCPENEIWEPDSIQELVRQAINFGGIDRNKVYLTGTSMGARGVWNVATTYPETFAALMPISGYSYYLKAAKIAKIPTWVLHGKNDDVVPIEQSIKMIETMKQFGGTPKLTLFNGNHDGLWRVYNSDLVYKWFLLHSK